MNNLSAYITELLVEFNFVSTDNKEICKYGIENLLISVIEITSILIIGSILEKTIPTIIFVATIVILRRYTGGYHANTKIGCYLVFVLSYIIFLVMLINVSEEHIKNIGITIMAFSNYIVHKFAPIVNQNKRVEKDELYAYRTLSIVINAIITMIGILGIILNAGRELVLPIVVGQMVVSLSILIALKKKRGEMDEKTVEIFE